MSNETPLKVVFLWHMHQPYYVDPLERVALMPWVRIHAVKGYLDMIEAARAHPNIKMSFNFTPVLVRQLLELAQGSVRDLWGEWARKSAADLTTEDRRHILENFFKINHQTLIDPFPRYRQLLELRGREGSLHQLKAAISVFSEQDMRDLQTWYNLAWCGFSAEKRFPELSDLKSKGSNFSEQEKNRVMDIHYEIIQLVLNLYRDAQADGQVEITTTPYFHPIMPLVYDTDFGKRAMPDREFPQRMTAPEDVRAHLRLAQQQHAEVFGRPARGLWPSEGSVAPELIPLFQEAGIEYFCTDEDNLFRSLSDDPALQGQQVDHLQLFQPWQCIHAEARVGALFRERPLSDFIGFNAARNTAEDASGYLLHHLEHLADVADTPDPVATLALDGENAWEAFMDGGEEFLNRLYQSIENSDKLTTATMGEIFDNTHTDELARVNTLHSGSWISANFDIWICDAEENEGWERIRETREFLVQYLEQNEVDSQTEEQAWDAIYAAEGSDWFWWYGPDFQTDCDMLFDLLFRKHLQRVYILLGQDPPASLEVPIQQVHQEAHTAMIPPRDFIVPVIGGEQEGFYEWMGAGYFDVSQQQTAMFQSDRVSQGFYYGFSSTQLYLRADFSGHFPDRIEFTFIKPAVMKVVASRAAEGAELLLGRGKSGKLVRCQEAEIAWEKRLEWSVPFVTLGWKLPVEELAMEISVQVNGLETERYPERGLLEFAGPSEAFQLQNWFI
ncbi:MAG: glycoside hydrolase family 57 protein [Verrucomicrobiota bacterium]